MAGGMILMGVLVFILPITSAMILHGFTQMGSNGIRAYLFRKHIRYNIVPTYFLGALIAFTFLSVVVFVPSKGFVLMAVGVFPFIALLTPKSLAMDVMKKQNSLICGFAVTAAQLLAGASGPVLDVFFIKSNLNRHEIMATKAFTQVIGHGFKLVFYGKLLYLAKGPLEFELYLFPLAFMTAFVGTKAGNGILERLSELQFQRHSKIVIALIGIVYIAKSLSNFI